MKKYINTNTYVIPDIWHNWPWIQIELWKQNKQIMILSTFIHWFYSFVEYVRYFIRHYVQNYKHFVDIVQ